MNYKSKGIRPNFTESNGFNIYTKICSTLGVVYFSLCFLLVLVGGFFSIIFVSIALPPSKQQRFEKYQIILVQVASYLTTIFFFIFWIVVSTIGAIGSYKFKSYFTKTFAYALIVLSLFNISNIILSTFSEIGLMLVPGSENITPSIIAIIGAIASLVVNLTLFLLCGFCAYKDSNSVQYSVITSEDLSNIHEEFRGENENNDNLYQESENV
jgi:uncharacterized membrane protein YgaE (UPF0421/DUF939 family)